MENAPPDNAQPEPQPEPRREPGWLTEPPTLRRIDWLAVAPWTVLLRAPGVAVASLPLVAGLFLLITLGGYSAEAAGLAPGAIASASLRWTSWARVGQSVGLAWWQTIERLLTGGVALYFASAAIRWAAGRLVVGGAPINARSAVGFAMRRTHRAVLAAAMLLLPGLLVAGVGMLLGGMQPDGDAGGFSWWLLFPLRITATVGFAAIAIGLAAAPMVLAAVAIDDADSFDAASRGVAYLLQRPLSLLGYIGVAFAVTLAGGFVVETLVAGAHATAGWMMGADLASDDVLNRLGEAVPGAMIATLLRAFYPASWIACVAAIYLVLRKQIDGQALDEIAPWRGDAADVQPQ
ncbi:MAG: hypothetical protein AAFV43_02795 [Planctomycetota bacterium]